MRTTGLQGIQRTVAGFGKTGDEINLIPNRTA
jgi:hypothetical protein